jgi:hypothetical protein
MIELWRMAGYLPGTKTNSWHFVSIVEGDRLLFRSHDFWFTAARSSVRLQMPSHPKRTYIFSWYCVCKQYLWQTTRNLFYAHNVVHTLIKTETFSLKINKLVIDLICQSTWTMSFCFWTTLKSFFYNISTITFKKNNKLGLFQHISALINIHSFFWLKK